MQTATPAHKKWIWPVTRYVTNLTSKQQLERHEELKKSKNPLERLWAIFHEGMQNYWDPEGDFDWDHFDVSHWSVEQREAGRKFWSQRVWIEYAQLPVVARENNRISLGGGTRGMEETLYPSVICFETTRAREVSLAFAEKMGGYYEEPAGVEAGFKGVIERGLSEEFYPDDSPLAPAAAGLHVWLAGLTAHQYETALKRHVRDELMRSALSIIVADKKRQAEYGWLTLEIALGKDSSPALRKAIASSIVNALKYKSLKGVNSTLDVDAACRGSIDKWKKVAAEAGMGCLTPDEEVASIRDYLQTVRQRLAGLGVTLPKISDIEA